MSYDIKKAAVIGAGIMGAGIAAHLANVGIPSDLRDKESLLVAQTAFLRGVVVC